MLHLSVDSGVYGVPVTECMIGSLRHTMMLRRLIYVQKVNQVAKQCVSCPVVYIEIYVMYVQMCNA